MIGCYYSPNYIIECCCKNGNDKFLGITIDTIFTACITIAIFILGFWLNKKNDERKEFDSLKDIKTYFLQLIEILISSTEKQVGGFRDFVRVLNEKTSTIFRINYSSNFTTRYINEIPNEKLFKIFTSYKSNREKDKSITLFRDLIVNLGLIREIENLWKSSYKDFLAEIIKYGNEYNLNASLISNFIDKMASTVVNRKIPNDDEFLIEFNSIVSKWQKMDNFWNTYIREENLINPLHKLCQKMTTDPRALELLKLVMECRYAYSYMEQIRDLNKNQFDYYSEQLSTAITIIQKSLKEIEQYKDIKPSII
jgi:hypothetical protein